MKQGEFIKEITDMYPMNNNYPVEFDIWVSQSVYDELKKQIKQWQKK